jgi:glycosyltransferase involved in cell wall biosynthesis
MTRADLHVHSKASKRPSEWFLQKVGAKESYTGIDTLYSTAKAAGMDFVTITDHNTIEGALELVEKYPGDTFVSVETTTYFPENGCKIHILVFDITKEQFEEIQAVRHDIYRLRDLIQTHDLAYSVAHGFYSINRRLTIELLEKLMLLFDVFESLNGARNRYYNEAWQGILKSLTPEKIQDLREKYKITPMSPDPWIKGFTGGSDDHAGLFIGRTATIAGGALSKAAFVQQIKERKTRSMGRCNDYKSFAFSIYKIFCDYSSHAGKNDPGGILSIINHVVFEDRQSRLKEWVTLRRIKKGKAVKDKIILKFFEDVYNWSHHESLDVEIKLANIYQSMGLLLDEFFKMLLDSFVGDFAKGDIGKLFRNLMSSFPAFFISIPFFSSLSHLARDRELMTALKQHHTGKEDTAPGRVLWFTDTLNDLNGVSTTLESFRRESLKRELNLTFVTCVRNPDENEQEAGNILYLPWIYSVTPEFYASFTLNFPSLLASMEMIHECRPERMIISTPGPVGMLGMIMGNLMGLECISVYHTDFAAQADWVFKDADLTGMIRFLINRFYSFSTRIKVPTREYIRILEDQGHGMEKMSLFRRGMVITPLIPNPAGKNRFMNEKGIQRGTTLLWAGRMSPDKNIEFLLEVYHGARRAIPELNLILCGDGPALDLYRIQCSSHERIHFTGMVDPAELLQYYETADLFVFPSTTDTFGMVILEAQSRGLPALVTDVGGPQEIIETGRTGHVLSLSDKGAWIQKIEEMHLLKTEQPNEFAMMRAACRNHIMERYSWDEAFDDLLGERFSKPGLKQDNGLGHILMDYGDEPIKGVA